MAKGKKAAKAVLSVQDRLIALCRQRGFVHPGSEIYGGQANSYDYGFLGECEETDVVPFGARRVFALEAPHPSPPWGARALPCCRLPAEEEHPRRLVARLCAVPSRLRRHRVRRHHEPSRVADNRARRERRRQLTLCLPSTNTLVVRPQPYPGTSITSATCLSSASSAKPACGATKKGTSRPAPPVVAWS